VSGFSITFKGLIKLNKEQRMRKNIFFVNLLVLFVGFSCCGQNDSAKNALKVASHDEISKQRATKLIQQTEKGTSLTDEQKEQILLMSSEYGPETMSSKEIQKETLQTLNRRIRKEVLTADQIAEIKTARKVQKDKASDGQPVERTAKELSNDLAVKMIKLTEKKTSLTDEQKEQILSMSTEYGPETMSSQETERETVKTLNQRIKKEILPADQVTEIKSARKAKKEDEGK